MSMRIIVIIAAILILVPGFWLYERSHPPARRIVLIAVLVALAVASRAAFFMVPFFKPVLAFAIIAGIALGPLDGFLVGALTALVSNFIFGQGPWTLFQMAAWGLAGCIAGLLARGILKDGRPIPTMIYGFLSAFLLHGLITDVWTIFFTNDHPTLGTVLAVYGAALIPNTILAIATVIFLALLGRPMIGKIRRVQNKYGI